MIQAEERSSAAMLTAEGAVLDEMEVRDTMPCVCSRSASPALSCISGQQGRCCLRAVHVEEAWASPAPVSTEPACSHPCKRPNATPAACIADSDLSHHGCVTTAVYKAHTVQGRHTHVSITWSALASPILGTCHETKESRRWALSDSMQAFTVAKEIQSAFSKALGDLAALNAVFEVQSNATKSKEQSEAERETMVGFAHLGRGLLVSVGSSAVC